MFIHNKMKMLLKNTIHFNSQYELNKCLILATDKEHFVYRICYKYLEYYNRCKRLTEVEKKYYELLDEINSKRL